MINHKLFEKLTYKFGSIYNISSHCSFTKCFQIRINRVPLFRFSGDVFRIHRWTRAVTGVFVDIGKLEQIVSITNARAEQLVCRQDAIFVVVYEAL